MQLKVLIPFAVFSELRAVSKIVAETSEGSFGILDNRADCIAVLAPGILSYNQGNQEMFIAVDQGVLIKAGSQVLISVRNAVQGTDLKLLRTTVEKQFNHTDQKEKDVRSIVSKIETDLLRSLAEFKNE